MMASGKPTWTKLLKRHGQDYLEWIAANKIFKSKFDVLADALSTLLHEFINTSKMARDIWQAVPAVLSKCNEKSTYKLPGAPYAYAWLHLLDRYTRTWRALEKLVASNHLPLAKNGVRILDVGTGPGPSAFAISDFYDSMTKFGMEKGLKQFNQPPAVTCVEFDHGTNSFRHKLAEIAYQQSGQQYKSPLAMCSAISDFHEIKPTLQRKSLQRQLRQASEEYYDEVQDTWTSDLQYSVEEANYIAQSLHRYRLITFSNFLTTVETVDTFEANLIDILNDAQPGAALLLIGGKRANYPEIYKYVNRLATNADFKLVIAKEEVSSAGTEVSERIFSEGAAVYAWLQQLAPNDTKEIKVVRSHFTESRQPAPVSQLWVYRKYQRTRRNN